VAVDAQYQSVTSGSRQPKPAQKDAAASANAKTAFQDFLFHYPKSESSAGAR
jgi:outer membrane protein assembly factor BamD (BamD/ComL family)